jgi:hypothetical protein
VSHEDDEFHAPLSDDPYWAETCWFTFTVPERRLSGQLYPFFQPNQGVLSAGAYFWDPSGHTTADVLHSRHFWHLPIPDQPLSDIQLPNGIAYRCVNPLERYELSYADPDTQAGGDPTSGPGIRVELTFTAIAPPNYLGDSHLDQPGRYRGTVVLGGESIAVDAFGFRDRSWGPRSQFGRGMLGTSALSGGYSYATASDQDAFHAITMDFGTGSMAIHGYVIRQGKQLKVASGSRSVLERDPSTHHPRVVGLDLVDQSGRRLGEVSKSSATRSGREVRSHCGGHFFVIPISQMPSVRPPRNCWAQPLEVPSTNQSGHRSNSTTNTDGGTWRSGPMRRMWRATSCRGPASSPRSRREPSTHRWRRSSADLSQSGRHCSTRLRLWRLRPSTAALSATL